MKELLFRGRLRPGADRDEVIANLARRFRRRPEQIEQRLFSGDTVRLATVESRAEAVRRAAEFARLGAMVEIRDAGTGDSGMETAGRARRWVVGGAVAVLVLAVTAGAASWYTAPAWRGGERSRIETETVRGLATEDLLFLGHIDVDRAVALEERLTGEQDPGALLGTDDDTWSSLVQSGMDPRMQIEDAILAGYGGTGGLDLAIVLLGTFEPELVRQWIQSRHDVVDYFPSTRTLHFRRPGAGDCSTDAIRAVRLAGNRIVIARPERLPDLARRMQSASSPAVALERWNQLTREQVATFGLFRGAQPIDATGGAGTMMLAAAAQANPQADALYLGLTPVLLPPGVGLNAELVSRDADYLDRTSTSARDYLDEAIADAERAWPELVPLYKRARVTRDGDTLRASLRMDTDFDDELGSLVSAAVADFFSLRSGTKNVRVEVVEEDPPRFRDSTVSALKPFGRWGDTGAWSWREGPFAVRVAETAVDGNRQLVKLDIEGRNLPNAGGRHSGVRFRIDDVVDADGESLLPKPECGVGPDRRWIEIDRTTPGSSFVDGQPVRFSRTSGRHTVALATGRTSGEIAHIVGRIEYALPVDIDTHTLEAPLGGEVVEQDGVRVRFQPGGRQELVYQYSGEIDRLLAVRGLNAQGQVLRRASSFSGERLFGRGRNASVSYQGDVGAAEVVIARGHHTLRYDVHLDDGHPALAANDRQPPPLPRRATPETVERRFASQPPAVDFTGALPRARVVSGPLLVTLERMQVSRGLGLLGSMAVHAPGDLSLAHDLNGAHLHVDRVVGADGTTIEPALVESLTLEPDGAYWLNGEYTVPEDRPWLSGSTTFQLAGFEGEEPVALEGRVRLRAATETGFQELSARVGNRMRGDLFDTAVTAWTGGSDGRLTLRVRGPVERIVAAIALDDERRRVDTGARLRRDGENTLVVISVNEWPATIRLLYATASIDRELRFRLEP